MKNWNGIFQNQKFICDDWNLLCSHLEFLIICHIFYCKKHSWFIQFNYRNNSAVLLIFNIELWLIIVVSVVTSHQLRKSPTKLFIQYNQHTVATMHCTILTHGDTLTNYSVRYMILWLVITHMYCIDMMYCR